MKVREGRIGRMFVLRLEHGDRIPDCIEQFAKDNGVERAWCAMLGGIDGGRLVVGPRDGDVLPPDPMLLQIEGAHEVAAVGTIFPDEAGEPSLHMHAAMCREDNTRTGCVRPGIDVWQVAEVVVQEIVDMDAIRAKDPDTGFVLLKM